MHARWAAHTNHAEPEQSTTLYTGKQHNMTPADCTYENIVKHYDSLIKHINEAAPEDAECMRLVVDKVLAAACFRPTVLPVYERWLREELAVDVGGGPVAAEAKSVAPATHRNLHRGVESLRLPVDPSEPGVEHAACTKKCTSCATRRDK